MSTLRLGYDVTAYSLLSSKLCQLKHYWILHGYAVQNDAFTIFNNLSRL